MGGHREWHQLVVRRRAAGVALAFVASAGLALASLWVGVHPAVDPVTDGAAAEDSSRGVDGVDRALDDLGVPYQRDERESARDVSSEAADLLEERRGKGDCVVSRAGYLDLFGGAWGCVLQGNGWAEVCVISEGEAGTGCSVVTWRLRAEDLGRLAGD